MDQNLVHTSQTFGHLICPISKSVNRKGWGCLIISDVRLLCLCITLKKEPRVFDEKGRGVYAVRSRRTPLIRLKKYVKTKILKDNEDINIVKKHQAIREEFVEGLETLHGSVYLADLIKGL